MGRTSEFARVELPQLALGDSRISCCDARNEPAPGFKSVRAMCAAIADVLGECEEEEGREEDEGEEEEEEEGKGKGKAATAAASRPSRKRKREREEEEVKDLVSLLDDSDDEEDEEEAKGKRKSKGKAKGKRAREDPPRDTTLEEIERFRDMIEQRDRENTALKKENSNLQCKVADSKRQVAQCKISLEACARAMKRMDKERKEAREREDENRKEAREKEDEEVAAMRRAIRSANSAK